MKYILISLLVLNFSFSAFGSYKVEYYELKDSIVVMAENKDYLINESCYSSKNCIAYSILEQKISAKRLNLKNGKNPGAIACINQLRGEVLMMKHMDSSAIHSFCLFKDGSTISNSTLYKLMVF